eukprot:1580527-Karenia_brevis.AAC.1
MLTFGSKTTPTAAQVSVFWAYYSINVKYRWVALQVQGFCRSWGVPITIVDAVEVQDIMVHATQAVFRATTFAKQLLDGAQSCLLAIAN